MSDYQQAANGTYGSYAPFQLFAGESDVVTNYGSVVNGLAQYTVLGRVTASGELVAFNPIATDGSETPVGVLAQATTGNNAAANAPYYQGGPFNWKALALPVVGTGTGPGTTTTPWSLANLQPFFDRTPIYIGDVSGAAAWTQT